MARRISPSHWPLALAGYAAAGIAIGVANQMAQLALAGVNIRPGLAVMIVVNLAMPLAMVLLTVLHPRVVTAMAGAVIQSLAFLLVALLAHDWHVWMWTPGFLAAATSPILVAATLGYAVIGAATALFARAAGRVVEAEPTGEACTACGYAREGNESGLCPECGTALRATLRNRPTASSTRT